MKELKLETTDEKSMAHSNTRLSSNNENERNTERAIGNTTDKFFW